MLLQRCAWHRKYHGRDLVYGIASWRGLSVQYTHGICFSCARLAHQEFNLPAPVRRRSRHDMPLVALAAAAAVALVVLESVGWLNVPPARVEVHGVAARPAPVVAAVTRAPERAVEARRPVQAPARRAPAPSVHRASATRTVSRPEPAAPAPAGNIEIVPASTSEPEGQGFGRALALLETEAPQSP